MVGRYIVVFLNVFLNGLHLTLEIYVVNNIALNHIEWNQLIRPSVLTFP